MNEWLLRTQGDIKTHRKHNNNLSLPFYNNCEIVSDLKAPESLVDKDVSDLRRWNEARSSWQQIIGGSAAGLDAERS